MPITIPAVPNVGDPTTRQLIQTVIQALIDLNASSGGGGGSSSGTLIFNGSFETDADTNGTPDNWTTQLQTNGAFVITGNGQADTACISGSKAIKFTNIGGASNGGGEIESDFFEVTPLRPLKIEWLWYCTSTSAANFVKIDFYDAAQSFISPTITVFQKQSGVNNPTSWSPAFGCAVPPATARYAKLTLIGCDSSVPTACSTYFDGVAVSNFAFLRRVEFHGNTNSHSSASRDWYFTAPVTGPYRVTCIGGGGSGAGDSTNDTGEVGGGSGSLAQSVLWLTSGTAYLVSAGDGGAGQSNASGAQGVNSMFGSSLVLGARGEGGTKNGAVGKGGDYSGSLNFSIGDIVIPGMDGGTVQSFTSGCGGHSVLGKAGMPGVYRATATNPDEDAAGAGGCGSWYNAGQPSGDYVGGHGGAGLVIIEW